MSLLHFPCLAEPKPLPKAQPNAIPKKASVLERAGTTKWAPRPGFCLPAWSPQQSVPEAAILQMANSWPRPVAARCGWRGSRLAPPGRGYRIGAVLGAGAQGRNVFV